MKLTLAQIKYLEETTWSSIINTQSAIAEEKQKQREIQQTDWIKETPHIAALKKHLEMLEELYQEITGPHEI